MNKPAEAAATLATHRNRQRQQTQLCSESMKNGFPFNRFQPMDPVGQFNSKVEREEENGRVFIFIYTYHILIKCVYLYQDCNQMLHNSLDSCRADLLIQLNRVIASPYCPPALRYDRRSNREENYKKKTQSKERFIPYLGRRLIESNRAKGTIILVVFSSTQNQFQGKKHNKYHNESRQL